MRLIETQQQCLAAGRYAAVLIPLGATTANGDPPSCWRRVRFHSLAKFIDILSHGSIAAMALSVTQEGEERDLLQKVDKSRLSNRDRVIHPLFVRITHWINAFAAIAMLMSGLRIYNASPLYGFRFPVDLTLGGWLAGALAWHFAVMWLLVINGLAYLAYGLFSGHFVRKMLNIGAMSAYRNIKLELKYLLLHGTGEYNIVQRVLYVVVIWDVILLFFSGLALWKPVQFAGLAAWLGGYEQARHIHFIGMAILSAFLIIHVSVAFAIKGTIKSMFTGRLTKGQLQRLERR